MDIVDRIFELVDQKFEEQRSFAYKLDLPPSIISEWRRRRSASFNKRLPQIAQILDTSVEYLLTGEKKEPITVSGDGQAAKLAEALGELGIDIDKLSDAEISRIARLAKAALEE